MRYLFILVLCLSTLSAYHFELTKKDKEFIAKSPKKKFINYRLKKYKILKKKTKNYPLIKKLSYTNAFFNKIIPQVESKAYGIGDYWKTPKEFLLSARGDCEDYAIAKYFTLLELGIPKEKLYFAIVQVKGKKSLHMVLLYLKNKNSSPLVLDNLSPRVLPFTKRTTLIPKVAFNEINAYKFTPNKFTKKARINWGKVNKWEKLLNRVYKEKE